MEKLKELSVHMSGNVKIKKIVLCLLLLIIGLLAYSNTLQAPFYFDDIQNIVENPAIRFEGLAISDFMRAVKESPVASRPFANISFGLNYFFHQYDVRGYHIVNIALHVLTAIFLFFLFEGLLSSPAQKKDIVNPILVAFSGALLWLVHPIQTQSVTYVVQRMNGMAAMFSVLSLLFYVKGRQTERRSRVIFMFVCSSMAWIFAFGSKEIGVMVPFFVLLLEWFFFQDLSVAWLKKNWLFFAGLFVFLFLSVYVFLGAAPLKSILSGYRFKDFTLLQRLLTEFRVIFLYLGIFFLPLPARLSLEHDLEISRSIFSPPDTLLAVIIICCFLVSGIFLAKKRRLFSFTLFWFFGNLLIESTIIPLELIFEHRMYMPSMFLCLYIAVISFRYLKKERLALGVMVFIAILFSFWTFERNSIWADQLEFHKSNAINAPGNWRAHYNYGLELYKKGLHRQAVEQFDETLKLEPRHLSAHQDLGLSYTMLEEYEKALYHYNIMLQAVPDFPDTYYNLGYLFRKKGENEKAISYFLQAAKLDPTKVNTHIQLGYLFAGLGKFKQAIPHFEKVLELSEPHGFEMQNTLGIMNAQLGDYEKAVFHFSQALSYDPGHEQVQYNLELARQKMQRKNMPLQ
jgi:tetratricopeptide (TPR) repeat protein